MGIDPVPDPLRTGSAAPPTFLLVLPWSPLLAGGVSVVVRQVCRHIGRGPLVPAVAISDWSSSAQRTTADGHLSLRFAVLHGAGPIALLKSFLLLPLRLARVQAMLREHRVAAVNFHYPSLDALSVALLKRLGCFHGGLTLSFHGTDARPPSRRVERLLWRWMLAHVDTVTACSAALAGTVAETFGLRPESVVVIHNGVDAERFRPAADASAVHGIELPARYMVSVGSYIPLKGHRVLLEAFAAIAGRDPQTALVIVGMEGPERAGLEAAARALGIGRRLVCLVDLDHERVAAVLASAALCVQPSFSETFGLAVIEAGACGVPLVASAVGGHLELLRDGETGHLFPAGDARQCAAAIERVLGDPEGAARMARRFRAEVLDRYTWQACADAYVAAATPGPTRRPSSSRSGTPAAVPVVAMSFCCPSCRAAVQATANAFRCDRCARDYPVLHGIADFRLRSDRYLSLDDERAKAARLAAAAEHMSFEQLLDHYYTITDDVSPLLAARYRAGVLAAPRHLQALAGDVAAALAGRPDAVVLDAGCGAGGMLLALHHAGMPAVGLDIALRWLVICRKRCDELGIAVPLVCADIEHPPFAAGSFAAVTAVDLVEHVPDVDAALGAIAALLAPAGRSWLTASNRRTLGPHPTTRIWGIGWLPHGLRAALLRRLRGVDALRFTHLLTAAELARRAASHGLQMLSARPRRIAAPDANYPWFERGLMRAYATFTRIAPLRWLLVAIGPSFEIALRRGPAALDR